MTDQDQPPTPQTDADRLPTLQRIRVSRASGPPVVVFCNGLGLPLEFWEPMLTRLDGVATVLFDRPWPARRPGLLTGDVDEIGAAVATTQGPVVLVGHSFGGSLVEAYARLRPDRAAALVLVDPSVAEEYAAPTGEPPADSRLSRGRRFFVEAAVRTPGALRGVAPWAMALMATGRRSAYTELSGVRLESARRMLSRPHLERAMSDDLHIGALSRQLLDLRAEGPLSIPTEILVGMRGPIPLPLPQRAWHKAQVQQAPQISTHAQVVELAGAHLLMLDQPDAVAAAVRRAVEQVRT